LRIRVTGLRQRLSGKPQIFFGLEENNIGRDLSPNDRGIPDLPEQNQHSDNDACYNPQRHQ
jgi:hypothetical protein